MKRFAKMHYKAFKLSLCGAIGMAVVIPSVMAWQEESQILGAVETEEEETSFITINELIKKQRGYIIHEGKKFNLIPRDIKSNSKLDLGSICEMLYQSNTPFESYFFRERIPDDEKHIKVNNVAYVEESKITAYKEIVFVFDKITGDFKQANASPHVIIQNPKYVYLSKSNRYLPHPFCDMERIVDPYLHWIDHKSHVRYDVHSYADSKSKF